MQAWASFAGAGAVLYAAHKGAATFKSWQGQKRAEHQIEAAERILALAYRLQRVFQAIRSPMQSTGEIEKAQQLLEEGDSGFKLLPDGKRHLMASAQVYYTRVQNERDHWVELFACLPLAKAYFGAPAEAALESFWKQRNAISASAQIYADDLDRDLRRQVEGDLWDGHNAARKVDDPINQAIAKAISDLEEILLPILAPETVDVANKSKKHVRPPRA